VFSGVNWLIEEGKFSPLHTFLPKSMHTPGANFTRGCAFFVLGGANNLAEIDELLIASKLNEMLFFNT
jgi:hypothetical protein